MTQDELIEQLADKEHSSWARWMLYLFNTCGVLHDGTVVIPENLVNRWLGQLKTPYPDLSEREKQSDRDEVAHILPIIREYALSECGSSGELAAQAWGLANAHAICIRDLQRQIRLLQGEEQRKEAQSKLSDLIPIECEKTPTEYIARLAWDKSKSVAIRYVDAPNF